VTTASPSSVDTQLEELSEDECLVLLGLARVGRIAFVVDALPVVLPINYRLLNDESGLWILLRTRPGRAVDGAPDRVAFEIDGIDYDHQQGWSVLVRGVLHHLDHEEIESFSRGFDPQPWPQQERTSWLAIKTETVTGRRLNTTVREWAFPSAAYL
jgi:nitroimidazol reductase NimA-like FMN-containing flavoprotein (pyridoxamine 5'-phosphate oxidase superfamily)